MLLLLTVKAPVMPVFGVGKERPTVNPLRRIHQPSNSYYLTSQMDGYGYLLLSSQDGDNVPFNYVDITSTGTALGLGDDACSSPQTLGFTFPFYDKNASSVVVCSNGGILVEYSGSPYLSLSNKPLPDTLDTLGLILPFWDDLNPSDAAADDVYFQSFATCPDGYTGACAVVQYHNVPRYGGDVYMDFEVILYDNGDIKFMYNSAMDYNDATVGIQDSTAAEQVNPDWFIQYVYGGQPWYHIPDSGTAMLFHRINVQANDALVIDVDPDEYIPSTNVTVEAKVFNADNNNLSNFSLRLEVYDTVTNTLVHSEDVNVNLTARTLNTVTFSSFTVQDRSYYKAVVFVTDPSDPDPSFDTAYTFFRTRVHTGDVLASYSLRNTTTALGYNLQFITYDSHRDRFFVSSYVLSLLNAGDGVYSFDPKSLPGINVESWAKAPIYDPNFNKVFSITSSDDGYLWLTHLESDGWYVYNQHLVKYEEPVAGVFAWTGDSTRIITLGAGLFYAIDYDNGAFWGVNTDGVNHAILKIDPNGSVLQTIPVDFTIDIPTGITYHPYTGELIITDGYLFYRLDTLGNLREKYFTAGYPGAWDLDVYTDGCTAGSTDPIVAYATVFDSLNTVYEIATGYYCDEVVSVAERPKVKKERVQVLVSGRKIKVKGAKGLVRLYDISGRRIGAFDAENSFTINRAGVYFVHYRDNVFKVVIR